MTFVQFISINGMGWIATIGCQRRIYREILQCIDELYCDIGTYGTCSDTSW